MHKIYLTWIKRGLGGLIGLILISSFAAASAQDSAWNTPLNLSQSGTASSPQLFQDSRGQFHILWQDSFLQTFLTASGDGITWGEATAITPPFAAAFTQATEAAPVANMPTLVADANDIIHAFWLDQGNLNYSQVAQEAFTTDSAWSEVITLASGIQALAATITANGQLSLLTIITADTPDQPAGVFYQGSEDGGVTWSAAAALYTSPYFRLLTAAELHLDIAPGPSPQSLIAAWDDPAQEQLFASQSDDGGITWSEPTLVDSREASDPANGITPARLQVIASQGVSHRLWLAGHNDANTGTDNRACALYHSWSDDEGETWSPRTHLLSDMPECSDISYLLTDEAGNVWLLALTPTTALLQVWTDGNWGTPQQQNRIRQFTDQQTFRELTLTCQQASISQDGVLVVSGCGGLRGQDIWVLSRSLGELANWLPQEGETSAWQQPVQLHEDAAALSQLTLVTDSQNQPHLFWVQPRRQTVENDPGTVFYGASAIYHTMRINNNWVAAAPILQSPAGDAEEIAVTMTPEDRVLIVWSNPQTGQLYFSQALSHQAFDANQWSSPLALPLPIPAATSPDIAVLPNGVVVIAYAIPVNEGRGIYLLNSADGGFTWSEPVLAFDGAAANWSLLDQLHIAVTNHNHLHILWRHQSLPPTSEPLALYYARSLDGGQTWSEAIPIVNEAVVWSDITGWSTTQVHITWREKQSGRTTLWHVLSTDDGLTMDRPSRITTFETVAGSTSLIQDVMGQLHLFQITHLASGPVQVLPFLWNEGTWLPEAELMPGVSAISNESQLASGITTIGELWVAAAGLSATTGQEAVWLSGRVLDMPPITITPFPTLTPTPQPTATITPQPSPTAEPTIAFPKEPDTANSPSIGPLTINSTTDGIIIGVFSATLLVGVVFLWGLRASRNRR